MQLHWSPRSPYVRKVMVCAHERGLADRLQRVRTVAAMLQPNERLMQDNPLSKIPTLVLDNGSALYDSAVICEYLDALPGGPRLFPAEGAARWQALCWQALGDGLLDLLILWRNEREREQPLAPLMAAFERKLQGVLTDLERQSSVLAAVPLTIGQVTIGCALGYLDFRFADLHWRDRRPALAAWQSTLTQRASFIATEPNG